MTGWGLSCLVCAFFSGAPGTIATDDQQSEEPVPIELREAPFPPPDLERPWEDVVFYARAAERAAKIPGLGDYLIVTAWGESKGNTSAINAGDGEHALRLFEREVNQRRFAANPWLRDKARWRLSGGALGLMPAAALATLDGAGRLHDPARVFDMAFAMAYGADMVVRLRENRGAVNFSRVRAGWAKPGWARKSLRHRGRRRTHERFIKAIRETAPRYGVSMRLAKTGVNVKRYPGFTAVLEALLRADGRAA